MGEKKYIVLIYREIINHDLCTYCDYAGLSVFMRCFNSVQKRREKKKKQ